MDDPPSGMPCLESGRGEAFRPVHSWCATPLQPWLQRCTTCCSSAAALLRLLASSLRAVLIAAEVAAGAAAVRMPELLLLLSASTLYIQSARHFPTALPARGSSGRREREK